MAFSSLLRIIAIIRIRLLALSSPSFWSVVVAFSASQLLFEYGADTTGVSRGKSGERLEQAFSCGTNVYCLLPMDR
jgi:hypothetical protein